MIHLTSPAARPAAVAGMFYPADAQTLRAEVDRLLDAAPRRLALAPKALIVPHAGYPYSGPIAATAYACLASHADHISRVVLIGPAHRVAVRGLATPGADRFATPLGEVPLDTDRTGGTRGSAARQPQRTRACRGARARSAAAVPAARAPRVLIGAPARRRRDRRRGGAGAGSGLGRRGDTHRREFGPVALPAVCGSPADRCGNARSDPAPHARAARRASVRCDADQRTAAGRAPARPRAAAARCAQFRRYGGRPCARGRLRSRGLSRA